MSSIKCKSCSESKDGRPSYDTDSCITCMTKGNYMGYNPKSTSPSKLSKRDKVIAIICLSIIHICSISMCIGLSVSFVIFEDFVFSGVFGAAAILIDLLFMYVVSLYKFKR